MSRTFNLCSVGIKNPLRQLCRYLMFYTFRKFDEFLCCSGKNSCHLKNSQNALSTNAYDILGTFAVIAFLSSLCHLFIDFRRPFY